MEKEDVNMSFREVAVLPGAAAVKKPQVTKNGADKIPKVTRRKQVLLVPVRTEQKSGIWKKKGEKQYP